MSPEERLWEAWKHIKVPEYARVEIDDDGITLTVIGGARHAAVGRSLANALRDHLRDTGWGPGHGHAVISGRKAVQPDLLVLPDDVEQIADPEGLGVLASGVALVVEIVWPSAEGRNRDHVIKHRAYATAGIPVYVIVDDDDHGGAVTILTDPDTERRAYNRSARIPYGEEALIPEGPAKGFVIGPEITGERRTQS
ncbi:Uma2 family endonuclease [Kitasatospora aureofaciens]|uniref:Uma2 family endonuclease n=1 Tax=Kitasatospora aureofaciens TaxID=1894 RepID=UPI001C47725C|nr:Uma2 family endonuclease [Kitasatospora aureofaciens]MBV6701962.1 Uma2 family endonuclease [Kitasatospora aureofaciens]